MLIPRALIRSYLCGTAQVIIVNLLDGLEVDDALQFALMFICGQEKQRCHIAKKRSLNKYFIAMFLFENELTREAKASVFFEKTSISKYFYWKTRES